MPPYQVIITSYCRPLYLQPTVESLRQSDGVQIFIVDGGSDPETCRYIEAAADGCLFFKDNPGADFLKTEGIKRFATQPEFMLTSDDLVYPEGAVPWAFAQYRMLNPNGLEWTFCACNMNHIDIAPPRPFVSYRGVDILEVETCQVSGAIIDTALCRELGYFPIYGQSGQGDWAFSKRLRERGYRMGYFRRPCLNHIGGSKWKDYPEYSKAFATDLKKYQGAAKRDTQA